MKLNILQAFTSLSASKYDWVKKGKRVIIDIKDEGAFIGTITRKVGNTIYVLLDDGDKISLNIRNKALLGEGVDKKRKSSIPFDQLSKWLKTNVKEEKPAVSQPSIPKPKPKYPDLINDVPEKSPPRIVPGMHSPQFYIGKILKYPPINKGVIIDAASLDKSKVGDETLLFKVAVLDNKNRWLKNIGIRVGINQLGEFAKHLRGDANPDLMEQLRTRVESVPSPVKPSRDFKISEFKPGDVIEIKWKDIPTPTIEIIQSIIPKKSEIQVVPRFKKGTGRIATVNQIIRSIEKGPGKYIESNPMYKKYKLMTV